MVQDVPLIELLVRDGKLAPGASAERRRAAVEADMRLQRSTLGTLKVGAERAMALGELDRDSGAFVLRFLVMLRERQRDGGSGRQS